MTTTTTVRNGIDVDALLGTIDAISNDSDLGLFTFRASSELQDGTHSTGAIENFTHAGATDDTRSAPFVLEGDEPPVLLGSNQGPNAVELVLQALAFCYSVGYIANAAARGIEITKMEYDIEGDLDVRSFLGLEGPRAGFTAIRSNATVSSPNATREQLIELCDYVAETSPVRDILVNPVPVINSLEVV
jgi:uncharacterized OsmC-like protein